MSIFNIFKKKKKIPAPWEKYYTKEQLNIEIPDISMYDHIYKSYERYPNYTAYEYLGRKVSYKKFIKQINKVVRSFQKLGVKKGDIVSICLPNVPESLICLYALNRLGAVASMIHPLSAEEELKEKFISTKSTYLVMYTEFYDKVKDVTKCTDIKKIIFVSAADSMNVFTGLVYRIMRFRKYKHHPICHEYLSWTYFSNMALFNKLGKLPKVGKNTPAVIISSGGTSGKPKNVVIQNRTFILESMQEKITLKQLKAGDCCLAILPNFHGFGLSVLMHTPLSQGCYTILVPQFEAKKCDTLFRKTRPTCVLGVPTLFEALMNCNNEKNLDLSFLKYIVTGGDVLSKSLEDKLNNYLKEHNSNARVTQGYGLSEALAAVTLAADDVNKSGSIGIPLAGNYIKIIDTTTREAKPFGEIGEICVHSKALMLGYLGDESETNEALQVHDDGYVWLHTGDLGYMDTDGFIFYKGRIKRMIITSGYNVYPSHIEQVIETHPAVLQCTVVGMPHPYKQEVAKAFIVLKDGFHGLFIKAEIKEYCKKNLAKYMVPYKFVYRKKLPKTKLGKVDFKSLKSDNGGDDDE